MDGNTSVWTQYQPGYVHPLYVPYQREKTTDRWGNEILLNTWKKNDCAGAGLSGMVDPNLLRVNKGLTFQRMFDSDPCPAGFKKSKTDQTYCIRDPPKHEQVFFTDKAFIPKRQYWGGYASEEGVRNSARPGFTGLPEGGPSLPRSSSTFDMRSISPLDGRYTVYFDSNKSAADVRYGRPVMNTRKQYDQNWYLPVSNGYATVHTSDSYLG